MDRRVLFAVVALTLSGCAATPDARFSAGYAAEDAKVRIVRAFAEPCVLDAPLPVPQSTEVPPDAPPGVRAEPGQFRPGVFLETALFLRRSARDQRTASAEEWARDPHVRLLGSPQLYSSLDTASRVAVETHSGPLDEVILAETMVTPRQSADAQLPVELDVRLLLPTDSIDTPRPPEARIHFLVAPRPGQTIALMEAIPELPGQSLLVLLRPYLIRSESDLRALFVCKMAQRQHARVSSSGVGGEPTDGHLGVPRGQGL